jgi:hypothetical protein
MTDITLFMPYNVLCFTLNSIAPLAIDWAIQSLESQYPDSEAMHVTIWEYNPWEEPKQKLRRI